VLRRAQVEHLLPQLLRPHDLAGPGVAGHQELVVRERLLELDGPAVLAEAVDEAVAGEPDQERTQLHGTGETPVGLAEAAEQIHPNRLHNVHRIEFGPQPRRQVPPNHHAQERLVAAEHLLRRRVIAGGQPVQKRVQRLGAHAIPSRKGSSSSEKAQPPTAGATRMRRRAIS
jgi:hypothetical protein